VRPGIRRSIAAQAGHQLTPRRVRFLTDDTSEPQAVIDEILEELFVLPVEASVADWAAGTVEWHCASV
jgi:hypothetical protein